MFSNGELYLSYLKHGFLHVFNAVQDFYFNNWNVTFLVYHHKDSKLYLGEYTRFRKQIIRKLDQISDLDNRDRSQIIDELDYKYIKIMSTYLREYVERIRRTKPRNISLFDYGQQMISKFHQIIDTFKIDDLRITTLDQKNTISFFFIWNHVIVASYCLYKQNDSDKFVTEF